MREGLSLDDTIYDAQSVGKCVTIDCVFGDPEAGEDEDKLIGWCVMCGDYPRGEADTAFDALFVALEVAHENDLPLYLSGEFVGDVWDKRP